MEFKVNPHFGMMVLGLDIPSSQSLKDKRRVVRSLRDRIKNKFSVSVAELKPLDKWQSAYLGFAIIGDDRVFLEKAFQQIEQIALEHAEVTGVESQVEFF